MSARKVDTIFNIIIFYYYKKLFGYFYALLITTTSKSYYKVLHEFKREKIHAIKK